MQCVVVENKPPSSLEKDFVQVLVEGGVGRKLSNELFSVLRQHNVGSFPCDLRKAVGTVRDVVIDKMCQGFFYYFGLEQSVRRACACFVLRENCVVHLQFNFDGLPLYKSSPKGFWPILCRVRYNNSFSGVFIVGLFFGRGKPASSHDFLQKFIAECKSFKVLRDVGNCSKCSVRIECFVCDTPARAFVKHVKGHGGYSSCERCCVRGSVVEGKIKFVERSCELRTDRSFREERDDNHHHGTCSPLVQLPIDMVRDFPLDYMHLVLLGVVRKLMCMWFPASKKKVKRSKFFFLHLIAGPGLAKSNRRALLCSKFTPKEFQRRPRSFADINYFKATEFRNIVCYLFPFIFHKVFANDVTYKHFNLLVVSMRLLLSPSTCPELVTYARRLLDKFVEQGGEVYGTKFYVNNVHALIHLCDDYERFGCLDRVSSFPFESYMYRLKRFVKRPGNELAQVVKRVKERDNWILPKVVKKNVAFLSYKHNSGPLGDLSEPCDQYLEIEMFGKTIRVSSNDDTILCSIGYCCVFNIVRIRNKVYFVVRKYREQESVFDYPCDSKKVGIVKCRALGNNFQVVPVREAAKCLKVVDENFVYVAKLLHESF